MTETTLNALRKLPAYRERREHIFQSEGALQWFIRNHRKQLIDAGALVLIAGQWHAREDLFDAYVLKAGAQAANQRLEAK